MDFFGIGPLELAFIVIIALLIFGPGKLPELARTAGKTVREFRRVTSSLTKDFREEYEKELRKDTAAEKKTVPESGEVVGEHKSILIEAERNPRDSG